MAEPKVSVSRSRWALSVPWVSWLVAGSALAGWAVAQSQTLPPRLVSTRKGMNKNPMTALSHMTGTSAANSRFATNP